MGFLGVWLTTHLVAILRLTWINYRRLGQKLDHGGGQPSESTDEVGSDVNDLVEGRCKHAGVGDIFQDGGAGDSSLWVGDVGGDIIFFFISNCLKIHY